MPSGGKLQQQSFQVSLPGFEFPPLKAQKSRLEKFKNTSIETKLRPSIAEKSINAAVLGASNATAQSTVVPQPLADPKEAWKPTVSFAEKNEPSPAVVPKPIIIAKTDKQRVLGVEVPEVREKFSPSPKSTLDQEQGETGFYIAARIVGIDNAPSVQAVSGSNLNIKPKNGYAVAGVISYDWGGFRREGEVLYAKADLDQIDLNDPGTIAGLSTGSFSAEGSQTYAGMLLNGAYDF